MTQPFDLNYGFKNDQERNFLKNKSLEDLKTSFGKELNTFQAVVIRKYHHENKDILNNNPLLQDVKDAVNVEYADLYKNGLLGIKKPTGTESIYAIQQLGIQCVQQIDSKYVVDEHLKKSLINAKSSTDGILGPNTLSFLQDVALWDGNTDGDSPKLNAIPSWNGIIDSTLIEKMLLMCRDDMVARKMFYMPPKKPGPLTVPEYGDPVIEKGFMSPDDFRKEIENDIAAAKDENAVVGPLLPPDQQTVTPPFVEQTFEDTSSPVVEEPVILENKAEPEVVSADNKKLREEFLEAEAAAEKIASEKTAADTEALRKEFIEVENAANKKAAEKLAAEKLAAEKLAAENEAKQLSSARVIEKNLINTDLTLQQQKEMEEMEKLLQESDNNANNSQEKSIDDTPAYNGDIASLTPQLLYIYLEGKNIDVDGVSTEELLSVVKESGQRGKKFIDTLLATGSIAQAERSMDDTRRSLFGTTLNTSTDIDVITLLNVLGTEKKESLPSLLPKYTDLYPILADLSNLRWYIYLTDKTSTSLLHPYSSAFNRRKWVENPIGEISESTLTSAPDIVKEDLKNISGVDLFDINKIPSSVSVAWLSLLLGETPEDKKGNEFDFYAIKDGSEYFVFDKNHQYIEVTDKSKINEAAYYNGDIGSGKYTLKIVK